MGRGLHTERCLKLQNRLLSFPVALKGPGAETAVENENAGEDFGGK